MGAAMFIGGWMLKRFGQNDRERTLAAEEGGLCEATLRDYRRKALTIFIWAGFAVLTIGHEGHLELRHFWVQPNPGRPSAHHLFLMRRIMTSTQHPCTGPY